MAIKSVPRPRLAQLEQAVFRGLNAVVEPAVRFGIGSPALPPASLIVLETVGYKSGARRRTPLWSLRFGHYRIVSTARGERSFWVRNVLRQPGVSFYLGGCRRGAKAFVVSADAPLPEAGEVSPAVRALARLLYRFAQRGWVFVVLAPVRH